MIRVLLRGFMLWLCGTATLFADPVALDLKVTDSYLELYSGPDHSYRIEHILLLGESAVIKKQYADWFYLEAIEKYKAASKSGWAHLDKLLDNRVEKYNMTFDEFLIHYEGDLRFDTRFTLGFIENDFAYGFEVGHALSLNSRLALGIRLAPGKISETQIISVEYQYHFNREGNYSPFVGLGLGQLKRVPSEQVVGATETSYDTIKLSLGLLLYKTKRMNMVAALHSYFDKDENEDAMTELSVGISYLH